MNAQTKKRATLLGAGLRPKAEDLEADELRSLARVYEDWVRQLHFAASLKDGSVLEQMPWCEN